MEQYLTDWKRTLIQINVKNPEKNFVNLWYKKITSENTTWEELYNYLWIYYTDILESWNLNYVYQLKIKELEEKVKSLEKEIDDNRAMNINFLEDFTMRAYNTTKK